MGGAHEHRDDLNAQDATARVLNSALETFQVGKQQDSTITLESFSKTFFRGQNSMEHGPDDVQQVHLAMMDDPTKIRVTFATGRAYIRAISFSFTKGFSNQHVYAHWHTTCT